MDLRDHLPTWQHGLYRTLREQQVIYSLDAGVRGSQTFTFRLGLSQTKDLAALLGMGERFALSMGVEHVRVSRHRASVDVEVSLPTKLRTHLPARSIRQKPGTWVGIGRTATGVPLHVNFAGTRTCHALISGTTGSGKTYTQRLIAWALASSCTPSEVQMLLIDAKGGVKWEGFQREIHLAHPLIGRPQEAIAALGWAVAEMDRRKSQHHHKPELFIVVDEIKELLDLAPDIVPRCVRRIATVGRELGVHAIIATQYPLADATGGSIAKANMPLRLTGRVLSPQEAYVSTGVRNSGAQHLNGNGDFLVTAVGETHRVQVAKITQRDILQLERREETPTLDLESYNPDRVLDSTAQWEIPPDHLAHALIHDRGISWLRKALHLGQQRATRLRQYQVEVGKFLHEEGHCIRTQSPTI